MRTRNQTHTNNVTQPIPAITGSLNGGSPFVRASINQPVCLDHDVETIEDDPSKGKFFKCVRHTRVITTRSVTGSTSVDLPGQSYAYSGAYSLWSVFGYGGGDFLSPNNIAVAYGSDEDALVRATLDAFYNQNEVDTLLNIVEAPELVTSTKSLFSKIANASVIAVKSRKSIARLMASYGNREVAFISGGYLYYKFGVAPLVNDFQKISRATLTYKKKLEQVIRKAGQKVSVHRSVGGTFTGIIPYNGGFGVPDYGLDDAGKFWREGAIYTLSAPKMTCTIQGIRNHKYSSASFQKLDYLIQRFGSAGPASFLWERIPFSFVVDWFLDLSGVINYLDNTLTGSTKNVTDACLSRKWSCLVPIIKSRYDPGLASITDGQQIAVSELRYYSRQAIKPSVSVGLSGRFGKNQLGITAALLSQMAANLRAKR